MNGDVAPDLYLVRGQQYTFIVEGGLGTDQDGIIHPFYLTSDNEVGHSFSTCYNYLIIVIYYNLMCYNLVDVTKDLNKREEGLQIFD